MNPATNDSLARAIQSLGAVEVGPEFYGPRIYAVKMPGGRYRVGNGSALIFAAKVAPSGSGVARDKMVLMPPWWTPEKRYAWRCWVYDEVRSPEAIPRVAYRDLGTLTDYERDVRPLIERGAHTQRITADLATGEEVPA